MDVKNLNPIMFAIGKAALILTGACSANECEVTQIALLKDNIITDDENSEGIDRVTPVKIIKVRDAIDTAKEVIDIMLNATPSIGVVETDIMLELMELKALLDKVLSNTSRSAEGDTTIVDDLMVQACKVAHIGIAISPNVRARLTGEVEHEFETTSTVQ